MDILLPWNVNIAEITVRPTQDGRGLSPDLFWDRDKAKQQNFRVRMAFVRPVALFGKAYTQVEYVHDRNSDEIAGTYSNEAGEAQNFYPMQAENFLRDLRILSAPEDDLTHAEWEERKQKAFPV